jgi:uncharacterized damage-inducible protein DinB
MSRVDAVRRLVGYDRRVFEAFERSAARLGWRAANRDHKIGHGTLKDTLVHILNVQEVWLVAAAQDRWEEVFRNPDRRPESVRSFGQLRRYREATWKAIDPLVRNLSDRALQRRVRVPWMPGRYTLEDAFYQASFEEAHHLGELIAVYRQMRRSPPQMMWIPTLTGRRVSVG